MITEQSNQPLLSKETNECFEDRPRCHCQQHNQRGYLRVLTSVTIAGIFVAIIALISLHVVRFSFACEVKPHTRAHSDERGFYRPSTLPRLKYKDEFQPFDGWNNGLYMGEPTFVGDKAWNALMRVENFKITFQDAQLLNLSGELAVPLDAGDGYSGILGVMHNLHCLRRLHQTLHGDYYYPNQTTDERLRDEHHNAHCLEELRQSLMCHPDLTPFPLYHSGIIDHDASANPHIRQTCVDWNYLHDWMAENKIP